MTAAAEAVNVKVNGIAKEPALQTSLASVCEEIHGRVQTFLEANPKDERVRRVQEQTRTSLRICEEALERYSLDELSISYNGGKDCLVLLILYLSALHSFATRRATRSDDQHHEPFRIPQTLPSVYILSRHPFQEVDDFVDLTSAAYHLSLARYSNNMKDAFSAYLDDYKDVKAIFVGTRRTDPHGAQLKHFDPTDRGWPVFMRIHPVIDWHYAEVWTFIRTLNIAYCPLYDQGYTSLGGTTDTNPNPVLSKGDAGFKPAYELQEDDAERLGRPT